MLKIKLITLHLFTRLQFAFLCFISHHPLKRIRTLTHTLMCAPDNLSEMFVHLKFPLESFVCVPWIKESSFCIGSEQFLIPFLSFLVNSEQEGEK